MGTDLWMESRMRAKGVGGIEQKGERTHGHRQEYGDCGGRGV